MTAKKTKEVSAPISGFQRVQLIATGEWFYQKIDTFHDQVNDCTGYRYGGIYQLIDDKLVKVVGDDKKD